MVQQHKWRTERHEGLLGVALFLGGLIKILDRVGLEARVCECHSVVKHEYDRLFPP